MGPTWGQLGPTWGQLGAPETLKIVLPLQREHDFAKTRCWLPKAAQEAPRDAQEAPRAGQEGPGAAQDRPKSGPGAANSDPRGSEGQHPERPGSGPGAAQGAWRPPSGSKKPPEAQKSRKPVFSLVLLEICSFPSTPWKLSLPPLDRARCCDSNASIEISVAQF